MTGPYETEARRSRPVHHGASTVGCCPQRLGKTVYMDGRTAAVQGTLAACLLGEQVEEHGVGTPRKAPQQGRAPQRVRKVRESP